MVPALLAVLDVFAHATGFTWDEALMVMAPIAGVAGVLFVANNRAKRFGADPDASKDVKDTENTQNP